MDELVEIAEWWDDQRRESERFIEEGIDRNPDMLRVVSATYLSTIMTLGGGFVDVLRIGEGVRRGGVGGYATDALRMLTLVAPALRGLRFASAQLTELRLLSPISADLGVCSWVASTQAMRMTGRLLVTIDELLSLNNFPRLQFLWSHRGQPEILRQIGAGAGTFLTDIVGGMRTLGATVTQLSNPTTMGAVEAATAARRNGVVLFNIEWSIGNNAVGHTLIGFRNALGQFRILDCSGHVVRNLAELQQRVPGYGNISSAVVYDEMYFVADTIVTQISGALSTIAVEVRAVANQ